MSGCHVFNLAFDPYVTAYIRIRQLFSAIYSGVQNAAAPSLLELLELLTPGAKKNCCMLNYLQMFIAPKLCTINADPSDNLHTSSTDRD